MYVGDGTWIADSNTFLLPNLQGLNFATMQYNSEPDCPSLRRKRTVLSIEQACHTVSLP